MPHSPAAMLFALQSLAAPGSGRKRRKHQPAPDPDFDGQDPENRLVFPAPGRRHHRQEAAPGPRRKSILQNLLGIG